MSNRAVRNATQGKISNWRDAFSLPVKFVYRQPDGMEKNHKAHASIVLASWEIVEFLLTPPSRHDVEGERLRYDLITGRWTASIGGWCVPLAVYPESVQWE